MGISVVLVYGTTRLDILKPDAFLSHLQMGCHGVVAPLSHGNGTLWAPEPSKDSPVMGRIVARALEASCMLPSGIAYSFGWYGQPWTPNAAYWVASPGGARPKNLFIVLPRPCKAQH